MKQELLKGARYWFTAEEEHELKEHNKMFQRRSIMEEVLYACFRPATAEDRDEMVQRLSAADIFKVLKRQNPAAMRELIRMRLPNCWRHWDFPAHVAVMGIIMRSFLCPKISLPPANPDESGVSVVWKGRDTRYEYGKSWFD